MTYFIRHVTDAIKDYENRKESVKWLLWDASLFGVLLKSVLTIIGYAFDKNSLLMEFHEASPAMALSTAVCLFVLSLHLLFRHRGKA
jgi:hypothetical protein